MKYELDYHRYHPNDSYLWIAILTGLPFNEIIPACLKTGKRDHWNGKRFIETFRLLGFNVNPRFIKFDPETEYPVIMRCQPKYKSSFWYGWIYYDGYIYESNKKYKFESWIEQFGERYRATSMLQVWI